MKSEGYSFGCICPLCLSVHPSTLFVLYHIQLLINSIFTNCEYSFEMNPFCLVSTNLTVNKDLKIGTNSTFYCKFYIYVHKSLLVPQAWDLLEKLFKFKMKKLFLNHECEKQKKMSLEFAVKLALYEV